MVDWKQAGNAVAGFGAGLSGTGGQFRRDQENMRQNRLAELQNSLVQNMTMAGSALEAGDVSAAGMYLQNQLKAIRENGGDPSTVLGLMQRLQSDPQGVGRDINALLGAYGGTMAQTPADVRAFEYFTEGLTPEQRAKARDIELGLAPRAGISAEERIAGDDALSQAVLELARGRTGATESTKDREERRNQRIAWGYDAAKGLPVAKRAYQLLQKVKTGGVDAIDIRTRRALGAESADQGELSNLLGKAVLSQLKATFGAQFTEKEGRLLMDIEAGINKGQGTNMRLMNQLIKRSNLYAKRAIEDATSGDNPDYYTAAAIQELLELEYDDDSWLGVTPDNSDAPVVRSQADFDALPSGAIFIEDGKQYRKP